MCIIRMRLQEIEFPLKATIIPHRISVVIGSLKPQECIMTPHTELRLSVEQIRIKFTRTGLLMVMGLKKC